MPKAKVETAEPLMESAADAARRVRSKEISARELTELLLARIDEKNPAVNAVVELRRDAALEEAAAADEAIARGDAVGRLHGVPMTVKEAFNVAGMHTTWGNPAFTDLVVDWDATVVRRLRRAGAIIAGKTNAHFMLADYGQTANELYGATNNPWDAARTPGGSSGGAAAAVSAGLTFLEYGSDIVGSIRIPASFCGIYGLKPSAGIVPPTGLQPPGPPPGPSEMTYMAAVGPLARSARDLRIALEVTAGPEGETGKAYSWSPTEPRHTRLSDFRVGFVLDHDQAPVSSEVAARLSNAVDALTRAGATVVEGWPSDVDPMASYESFGFHVQLFLAFQQPGADAGTLSDFIDHENRRMAVRATWSRYFNDVDVFLCPANFTPAFPHDTGPFHERTIGTPEGDRSYNDQVFWVSHASLPGLPAAVAPVGRTPDGLPAGAQIIGPLFEDHTVLTFAELLGEVAGGYEPPPM